MARKLAPDSKVSAEEMEQGHPPIAAFEQYIKGLLVHAPASKISFLSQALRVEPAFHRVRIELWNAYTDLSEHQQALAAVRDVPAGHRLGRQARFLGAISMLNLAQYQPAFTAFSELNATRTDPAILNNLGVVQLRRPPGSATPSAASFFRDATTADNTDSDLFFNLGYAYWALDRRKEAEEAFRSALQLEPKLVPSHFWLGVLLEKEGRKDEARRHFQAARDLDPGSMLGKQAAEVLKTMENGK